VCRSHGAEFLEAVAALDTGAVERARRVFWRRLPAPARRLLARADAAAWLRRADLRLHQAAVDLLLPDVLRPIPPQLTQVRLAPSRPSRSDTCSSLPEGVRLFVDETIRRWVDVAL
jgi:hypothetical protein